MKHVLVTAGCVYGRLDDNKLVGNRIRGIWATKFACWLHARGYKVSLLIPDTMDKAGVEKERRFAHAERAEHSDLLPVPLGENFDLRVHTGYDSYAEQCYALAPDVDAAVMAAAVVNWIPKEPIKGKMKTEGFQEGAVLHIPFYLAPRVIDRMKKLNPKLTLIGCKMTSGATREELMKAAYTTLIKAHANVVIANDLSNLKQKVLIFPDGSQFPNSDFEGMYRALQDLIEDEHYRTETDTDSKIDISAGNAAAERMDRILAKYREGFTQRNDSAARVFGGIAVRAGNHYLVSPREKGTLWTAREAVLVTKVKDRVVYTVRGRKASLNAPVLVDHLERWKYQGEAVLHQHRQMEGVPTEGYAPPGTVRDNERYVPARTYNIEGHGFIALLDDKDEILR